MRQIKAINAQVTVVYRFDNKDIYIKTNNLAAGKQLMAQIQSKGGKITEGKVWIKADIFRDNKEVKMGGIIMNLNAMGADEIEEQMFNFFKGFLEQSGFKVEAAVI